MDKEVKRLMSSLHLINGFQVKFTQLFACK